MTAGELVLLPNQLPVKVLSGGTTGTMSGSQSWSKPWAGLWRQRLLGTRIRQPAADPYVYGQQGHRIEENITGNRIDIYV